MFQDICREIEVNNKFIFAPATLVDVFGREIIVDIQSANDLINIEYNGKKMSFSGSTKDDFKYMLELFPEEVSILFIEKMLAKQKAILEHEENHHNKLQVLGWLLLRNNPKFSGDDCKTTFGKLAFYHLMACKVVSFKFSF